MDLIYLVPLFVSLCAVLPPASAAEELPPPELSVLPPHRSYYEGDRVELTCTAKINRTVAGYRFFNQSGPMVEQLIGGFGSSRLLINLQRGEAETYSCKYWRENKEVLSQRSNIISLLVKEAPRKPSLTLNHTYPEYRWGDDVSLICSAPPEAENIIEFQYFGERQTIHHNLKPLDNTDIHNLTLTDLTDIGNFRCAYIQFLSNRNVRSKKSDYVFIDPLRTNWERILATGGIFFTVNGLIFLITHCYFLPKVSKRNVS